MQLQHSCNDSKFCRFCCSRAVAPLTPNLVTFSSHCKVASVFDVATTVGLQSPSPTVRQDTVPGTLRRPQSDQDLFLHAVRLIPQTAIVSVLCLHARSNSRNAEPRISMFPRGDKAFHMGPALCGCMERARRICYTLQASGVGPA